MTHVLIKCRLFYKLDKRANPFIFSLRYSEKKFRLCVHDHVQSDETVKWILAALFTHVIERNVSVDVHYLNR